MYRRTFLTGVGAAACAKGAPQLAVQAKSTSHMLPRKVITGTVMQPEHPGSWTYWFVDYLKRHKRLDDLGFYSFEFYVFDNLCGDLHPKLIEQGDKLALYDHDIAADGVPRSIPWIISEYGWSAFSGRAMSQISSAELMANIVGQWLTLGGSAAYMFGYPPGSAINQLNKCAGYGDMMLFLDDDGKPGAPLPIYYTAKLLTEPKATKIALSS